jgi:hypothetical protein
VAEVRLDEASFQRAVTDLCDWYGLRWHHEVDSRKSKRGLPDLVIIGSQREGGPVAVLWRELKADDGKLRPDQNAWGGDLVASGSDWAVWKPEDWRSGRIRRELEAIR